MVFRFLTVLAILLYCSRTNAQTTDHERVRFQSINNIGILASSGYYALQLQTVNGVNLKNWFAGAGVGLDYYRYRTIPIFVDIRHWFGENKNKWFVYGDIGDAVTWITAKQKNPTVFTDTYKGRGYLDLGGGYTLKLFRTRSIMFSAGYSLMHLKETLQPYYFGDYFPPEIIRQEHYQHWLSRVSLKAGISF